MGMKFTIFTVLPTHQGGMDYTGDVHQRWEFLLPFSPSLAPPLPLSV